MKSVYLFLIIRKKSIHIASVWHSFLVPVFRNEKYNIKYWIKAINYHRKNKIFIMPNWQSTMTEANKISSRMMLDWEYPSIFGRSADMQESTDLFDQCPPYEKCNDRSNKSTVPLPLLLSLSLSLLPPLLLLLVPPPIPKWLHIRKFAVTAATNRGCGYRYVTLVGTCKRYYPLPQRAILKIEKHLSCNTRENGTGHRHRHRTGIWKYPSVESQALAGHRVVTGRRMLNR